MIKYLIIALAFFVSAFLFLYPNQKSKQDTPSKENIFESAGIKEEISTTTVVIPKSPQLKSLVIKPRIEVPQITQDIPALPPATKIQPFPVLASSTKETVSLAPPPLPLDENSILSAVVKIECPTTDGLGKYIGSGFALKDGVIVTAAHVVKDSGSQTCSVIFPRERRPIYYLKGTIDNLKEVKRRHDEEGIDVAVLKLPLLDSYPEARAIFNEYPFIPYPICENPGMLGDILLHFGYPTNYADQNYLSRLEGKATVFGDIKGIKEQLSEDQTFTFKTPIFSFTSDKSQPHPYMISRVASFYGDSGGLAFDATRQCILGPHRGGTIGKSSGENYSIFMVLGWEKALSLIPLQ